MDHTSFFTEFLIIMAVSALVAIFLQRLRLPAILGFLLAGVLIGPSGLKLIHDFERIHMIAEVGMILLMLTIGLEFSFRQLKGLGKIAILGGTCQISLSILIAILFSYVTNWSLYQGFVLGAVMALSSTAIVFKFLIDRGELDTQQGKLAVALLIFQDLAVLPLVILVTSLGQTGHAPHLELLYALLKSVLLFGGGILFARIFVFRFIHWVALSRSREVFLLTATVVVFGMAWFSNELGLTMAIGAFLAGLMFANTQYGHQIASEIVPFRHIFVSLFFVSIGLLFDVSFMFTNWTEILAVVALVFGVKFLVTVVVAMFSGYSPRVAITAGIMIAQMGEFSFLLLESSRSIGAIETDFYNILLSSAFITMVLTPFLFNVIPHILHISERLPIFGMRPQVKRKVAEEMTDKLHDHVILCGFGPVGKDLASAFQEENIPFIVIDMNPQRIQEARINKYRVIYGDAANEEVIRRLGIARARAVVVTFGDAVGMAQIVRLVQRLNPAVLVVVRTRYEREVAYLYDLGADFVVMEELEASLELNRLILEDLGVERAKINDYLGRIRVRKELAIEEAIFKKASATEGD